MCGNCINMIDEIQMGEADGGDRITGCVTGKVEYASIEGRFPMTVLEVE